MTDIAEIAASLPLPEQRAVAIVGLMIRMHGGKDGEGLFAGVARYGALVARLKLAAERSRDVRSCWDLVTREMLWTIGPMKHDEAVLDLVRPSSTDPETLSALADRAPSIVMIARSLAKRERDADRPARDYAASPLDALAPDPDDEVEPKAPGRTTKSKTTNPDDAIQELF